MYEVRYIFDFRNFLQTMPTMKALLSKGGDKVAALTIRHVDDSVRTALRVRAAQNGVSMEEEARRILWEALLRPSSPLPMGQHLLNRFSEVADECYVLPERHPPRTPPARD